jgi:hypothetical protein
MQTYIGRKDETSVPTFLSHCDLHYLKYLMEFWEGPWGIDNVLANVADYPICS